jgi:hypothetical protein
MKKGIAVLFAVAVLLGGCAKKPTEYLTVTGINTATGEEIELHSQRYGLDYTGTFSDCNVKDPLTGDDGVSFKKSACPDVPVGATAAVIQYNGDGSYESHTYAMYTKNYPGGRQVKSAYRLFPDIR